MGKKLYRYRSFNTDIESGYSYIHNSMINIEKWKFEAFEGLVYPSSPLYFNDPYDCEFCFRPDILENIVDSTRTGCFIQRMLKEQYKWFCRHMVPNFLIHG